MPFSIPQHVSRVTRTLKKGGFEAFLVGGCVRDLQMGIEPKDWDITTNARPDDVQGLFEKTVHENDFGMVAVIDENEPQDSPFRTMEVTTYRSETTYSNFRHPDSIEFAETLEEDLKRRDFTMNALAYDVETGGFTDLYGGLVDIENKVIKAVGDPDERFNEDALRIVRAVRFSAQLGFGVSHETKQAISKHIDKLSNISAERIRDEFVKLIMAPHPMKGIIMAHDLGVLQHIVPELEQGIAVDQNKSHIFDVWTHLLKSLEHAAHKDYPLHIRLSALFHDIGKPATRRFDKAQKDYTFYGHEVVGARMVKKIMKRLRFSRKISDDVEKLVRWHMFFSDPEQITLSAVRRMIRNVGEEMIWDLMNVRVCDRIGMGRPKEEPYRLRQYHAMIDQALRDPVSVKQLKINGDMMISEMNIAPGPRMGWMLHALLEEVLDDPGKNTIEYLRQRVFEYQEMSDEELRTRGEEGKTAKDIAEAAQIAELKKKRRVK